MTALDNKDNKLEKSILETVAYFDIFSYPLTLVEIWKWLFLKEANGLFISLNKIEEIIKNSEAIKTLLEYKQGFYFFKNREALIALRKERYNLAENKFRKALRVAGFLKWIPGIKMIGICNSLSWANADTGSDIDFFIVTEKGKLWTSRFLAVGFLKIFGLRPEKNNTKDKICLSFFVDEEHLNLENLAIESPDIYLIYWINQLVPIFDRGGVHQKFLESNQWIKIFLPNIFNNEGSERRRVAEDFIFVGRKEKTAAGGLAEKFLHKLQYQILPKKIKEVANQNSNVVVKDGILKFHCDNDRRKKYQEKWFSKIKELERCL
ncbi:hypothetical protein A2316_00780 [Candidatus Falkowbacteria bacterium RIFOXYB2_FULL_38_15]|uniref:Polymerase nucleotidyl transferase domain-containing protein n=1 Tax=Candidatus Falkowbacteria bacterium RIFOXYA2_FULL_38_12 TaxID=1797993 RepID=A0A1F5S5A1_9BACT|nr:MAG: hypothetical protein A2257_02190 [Candidatus Falkowbacteria bacterium RIFOXYA2_FULL_38_12]OGF32731.1 MAG: hypothetical protein A2316_00780 [Candidatus Falkowbacteria bacterium RIFOXYB2_FULL_38_15]OGF42233.1 MAG: hypothetical protein A2555_03115 [Candidatus Falkowbacteria bacterium RIFOXYD2_FULL_39_16]